MRVIAVLLLLLFLSCGKSDTEKAAIGIKDQYIEEASKASGPLTIYDVNIVAIEDVGEGRVDTLHRSFQAYAINVFAGLKDSYTEMARESRDSSGVRYLKEAIAFQDSLSRHMKLDSVYRTRIQQRKDDPTLYHLTTAYIKKTSGKEVVIDTLKVVLDKDFKYVKSFEIL